MTIESRIAELKRRHDELSEEVESLERSPGVDDLLLQGLKKRKLHLKDEMTRLQGH